MSKRFKLKMSFLLSSCRPKNPSSSAIAPTPIFRTTTVYPPPTVKRRVSSSSVSLGCNFRSKPKKQHHIHYYYSTPSSQPTTPRRRKVYNTTSEEDDSVYLSPAFLKTKLKPRVSNSSVDTGAWFSSSEEISKTFSTNSSFSDTVNDGSPISGLILKKKPKKRSSRVKKVKYYGTSKNKKVEKKMTCNSPETKLLGFGRLKQTKEEEEEEGKMKESLAVMKKSEDPYGDFRRSMMEMIVEKEMFEASDLEQLLQCFLTLNSKHHYDAIIEAFSDIWEILFSNSTAM